MSQDNKSGIVVYPITSTTSRILVEKSTLLKNETDELKYRQWMVKMNSKISPMAYVLDKISVWGGCDYSDDDHFGWEVENKHIDSISELIQRF